MSLCGTGPVQNAIGQDSPVPTPLRPSRLDHLSTFCHRQTNPYTKDI